MAEALDSSSPAGAGDRHGDGAPPPTPLLAWSLATFHAALVVVVPVTVLHAVGVLGDLLAGLGTAVGLGLFVLLWGITWTTNRRWLAECDLPAAWIATRPWPGEDAPTPTAVLGAALKWGAITGLAFFYGLLVLAVVPVLYSEAITIGILLIAGTLVAPVVGAAVGGVLAFLDLGLLRLTARLVPARPTPASGSD